MRILIVGSGGREHALAWKIARSPEVSALYGTRPNGGMAPFVIDTGIAPDATGDLVAFAAMRGIDLVVVGPEAPLAAGLADALRVAGVPVVGPDRAAARLEASKAFAKEVMEAAGVPTAPHVTFTDADAARAYVRTAPHPLVVKASGLAAGKGVFVCETVRASEAAVRDLMQHRIFGAAGDRIVVEAFLEGEEMSFIALCHGLEVLPLATSQDHKRLLDGDRGPNTGGMGAICPAPPRLEASATQLVDTVVRPVLAELARRGLTYRGFLYAGLMWTADGPRVLEFNVRLGDPEAQAILPRLQSDLVPALWACARGEAASEGDRGVWADVAWQWDPRACAVVVAASAGYPGKARTGVPIEGLEALAGRDDVIVFHAGTRRRDDGRLVTSGGRVLAVAALGADHREAIARAYAAIEEVHFDGMQVRRDIGHHALGA
jgi:phosphoribosylamine--glycine ligase